MDSESFMNLMTDYSETSPESTDFIVADADNVGVDNHSCTTLNGQSRQRDAVNHSAGSISLLKLPTSQDIPSVSEDDEKPGDVPKEENETDPSALLAKGNDDNMEKCSVHWVGVRLLDVCC